MERPGSRQLRDAGSTVVVKTFDHDDLFELPPFGEASSLFNKPVTATLDHWRSLAFRHELPRTPLLSGRGKELIMALERTITKKGVRSFISILTSGTTAPVWSVMMPPNAPEIVVCA